MMRRGVQVLVFLMLFGGCVANAAGEPPEYAVKSEAKEDISFLDRLKRDVPPLRNPRGDRYPMILWECVSFDPQPPEVYAGLLERGLAQHIRLDEKMLPTALALKEAGSPVIIMEGGGGPFPYNKAADWQHQYEEGYEPNKSEGWWESVEPCIGLFEGWRMNADRVRQVLNTFKDAGVTVDAVWLDWECAPANAGSRAGWENARHCVRCRETLPPAALKTREAYRQYCRRLSRELFGAYVAAPIREVFPRCSVTNWHVVFTTAEHPVETWGGGRMSPCVPSMVTATNPVAYGNTVYWKFWNEEWPLDRLHVDRFYTHLLLREVSVDEQNKRILAPETESIPWVDRWCPDDEDPKIPLISRAAYREALRHMWLRGVDGMQVFNPRRPGYEETVFAEVADAVAVYDEMLAHVRFLDEGEPMNLGVPEMQFDGVLWSGLRLDDAALIRAIHQAPGEAGLEFEAWPGTKVELTVGDAGRFYLLRREGEEIRIEEL